MWPAVMVVGFFVALVVGTLVADHFGKLPTIDELHEQDQERWAQMNPTSVNLDWDREMDELEAQKYARLARSATRKAKEDQKYAQRKANS